MSATGVTALTKTPTGDRLEAHMALPRVVLREEQPESSTYQLLRGLRGTIKS